MTDAITPTATFVASRVDLTGPAALLGSAELARQACRRARSTSAVVAVTAERVRRVDLWLAADAVVTHPVAASSGERVVGSVGDRSTATAVVTRLLGALAGPLPTGPAPAVVVLPAISQLTPTTFPAGVRWVVVLADRSAACPPLAIAATDDGLVAGTIGDLGRTSQLAPMSPEDVPARLAGMLGPPGSIAELLAD